MWGLSQATIRPPGQPEANDDESANIFGVPLPTNLYGPQLRGGRWLQPDDEYMPAHFLQTSQYVKRNDKLTFYAVPLSKHLSTPLNLESSPHIR